MVERYAILRSQAGWEVRDTQERIPSLRLKAPFQKGDPLIRACGTKGECEQFVLGVTMRLNGFIDRYDVSWRSLVLAFKFALSAFDQFNKDCWLEVARVLELELLASERSA